MKKSSRPPLPMQVCLLVGAACLLLGGVSCGAAPDYPAWVQADLRALDPPDASSPAADILAVYTRTTALSVDIRVDLLDINPGDRYGLKIVLWDGRDFSATPLTVLIASTGAVQTGGLRAGQPYIWPRVLQDTLLDTITVNLPRAFIGERYRLDVSSYTTDPLMVADEVSGVRSNGRPPAGRAPLLVAFREAFPVVTPAQALRRWDGAHTGPLGQRHGLKYILDAARQTKIPVALVDLKDPASLAALDFMGVLPEIRDLYAGGLLILPDVAYSEPANPALGLSARAAAGFNLPASPFVYALSQAPLTGYRAQFLSLADATHLAGSGAMRLIPLPSEAAVEATEDGPSLQVRRALIATALSPDPADLVVLGGDLPQSTWGDPDMTYPTFEWIAAHPWIQPLSGRALLGFPAFAQPVTAPAAALKSAWLPELQSAPVNAASLSAWQTYLMLSAPTPDAQLGALRSAYLGQVGELLAAADWAEKPAARADCKDDLNGDGRAECILANLRYFAVFESAGARLTQFFYLDANGPHQLVGPSAQFAVGLSDPSEWRPERGEAADPTVIPGAFVDDTGAWTDYDPIPGADGITFTSPDGGRVKAYRLTENGLEAQYRSQGQTRTRIPLALDPQRFYSGSTDYLAALAPHSWTWSQAGGSRVEVRSDATLSGEGFISALPFLGLSEDPNLGYPQGDYLPFPLSLVTLQAGGNFSVEIKCK